MRGKTDQQEWVEQWYSDTANDFDHQQNTTSASPLKNEGDRTDT